MTDVADIAKSLHASDRTCILGDPKRLNGSIATLLNLCLHDLAEVKRDNSVSLNDRGLAVRAHLKGASHD